MSTLVLVPSPLRAARAARRLCDVEGGILFGARVVTPGQLAPGILAAAGDPRALLAPLAERLLAIESARECGLAPADWLDPAGGLARSLGSAVSELRAADVSAGSLDAAARAAPAGRLRERLATCARLLRGYEVRLEALRAVDRAGALAAAAAALHGGRPSEELRDLDLLVLEGFAVTSAVEWRLVEALASRARRTHARVPFFPDRADIAASEPLLRRVEALQDGGAHGRVDVRLEGLDGARAGGIETALLSVAGGPGGGAAGVGDDVRGEAGAGEDGEAGVAADLVARWLDSGVPPEEVLVFAPSPAASAARLSRELADRGVPFACGAGASLEENPAVRAVRRALAAAAGDLGRAAAEELLASTYVAGASPPPRIRDLLDRAGAVEGRTDPEDALRRRAVALGRAVRERQALLRGAEAIADLRRRLAPLRGPGRARDHAARLRAFVAAGVRRRAARGEPMVARRDLAALKRLDECADAVVTALAMTGRGAVELSTPEWMSLLDAAVAGAASPSEGPAAGAVELWALADAPGLSGRAVVITGCARGAFPPAPDRAGLLRDPERAAVNSALGRAALQASGAERAAALHAAFCAIASAREALALTWPAAANGCPGGPPAALVAEVLAAAGRRADAAPRPPPPLAAAKFARQALEAAARHAAAGEAPEARAALRAASPPLAERFDAAAARGVVEQERRAAAVARSAAPHSGAVLPGPLLGAALPHEWSPSQLETHARCPFRFFLETPCELAAPDEALLEASPRAEGKLLHVVLERFVGARLGRGATPISDDEGARAELRAVAEQVFRELQPTGKLGDPALWPAQRELLANRLERVLASEAAVAAEDGLQPRVLEHAFGGGEATPALVLSDGARDVRLCGRVDRIDASPDRLRVLDWKGGRASSGAWREKVDPEAFGVTSFQLPTYLMAARRLLPGRARLEAAYVFLRSASRSGSYSTDAADPVLAAGSSERAHLRAGGGRPFADAVLDVVSGIRDGSFPISPRDCGGCPFGAVCRAEGSEEDDP